MKTNHTPGPWKVSGCCFVRETVDKKGIHELIITTDDDERLLPGIAIINAQKYFPSIKDANQPDPEAAANARLMASAPAMLEALEYAAKAMETARRRFPKSIKNPDTFQLENALATIGKAIHQATNPA